MAFDLDKVLEEEAAEGRPSYEFTFDGKAYTLPPAMDIRAIAAIAGSRLDDGLRLLLNPEQWQSIQDSPKLLSLSALEKLFDDYAEFTGTDLGKASTPSTSSPSTVTP